MKLPLLILTAFTILGAGAGGGPVKVTIQSEKNEFGEGSALPVDPQPRVRFGVEPPTMMPGLGGLNNEPLTISPQGGHEILVHIDGSVQAFGQMKGKWVSRLAPLGKSPGGKATH